MAIKLVDNHFQINLPFIADDTKMPNNYDQTKFRVEKLRNKFQKDGEYFKKHLDSFGMSIMIPLVSVYH